MPSHCSNAPATRPSGPDCWTGLQALDRAATTGATVTKPRSHPRDRAVDATPATGAEPRSYTRADLPPALDAAIEAALDKQGRGPVVLQVTEVAGYTDWVLIVSARSERQVAAIADGIQRALRDRGVAPRGVDGVGEHLWELLDYDDFMVHVFFHPVRTHYDLESMWSDAPRVALGLPADVMDTIELDQLELPENLPGYRGDAAFGGFDDEFGNADEDPIDDFDDDEDDDLVDDELAGDFGDDDDTFVTEPVEPGEPGTPAQAPPVRLREPD
ncbi:MAG: ribosome silencing factor [Deltaproteobacteria bacterium]|nr:ribosome silencing factor [Nannocystaceae bacterium]